MRLLLLILMLGTTLAVDAQVEQGSGSILIQGKPVKVGDKLKLARKRFYLFSGGLKENGPLLERIRTAEITSRDCYYTQIKASPGFMCWLQQENCEGPFCRKVNEADVPAVPEFNIAYKKGLAVYHGKNDLALSWLLDNLDNTLVTGYYRQQQSIVDKVLGGIKPLQTTMATITAAEAYFVDVAIAAKPAKYLVSTILPVEIGGKSYVWTCEVTDLGPNKFISKLPLSLDPKAKKNCEVTIRDVQVCKTGACPAK